MAPPKIFDQSLMRARRRRALPVMAGADFLARWAADDIAERMSLIKRRFPLAIDLAGHTGLTARVLAASDQVDTVIRTESFAELVAGSAESALVCDLEALPFGENVLDLVVSTLSLHLVNDLPGTLVQICRALRPDGLFLATLLGTSTLMELRQSLLAAETDITGGASPRVAPFIDVRDLGGLLQRAGFALPVTDADRLTVTYPNMFALMQDLRAMGMTNMLSERSRTPLRRGVLMHAAAFYAETFATEDGRIRATFELVHAAGWRPHESQQKPLKPGSAQTRLADALNTKEQQFGGGY